MAVIRPNIGSFQMDPSWGFIPKWRLLWTLRLLEMKCICHVRHPLCLGFLFELGYVWDGNHSCVHLDYEPYA